MAEDARKAISTARTISKELGHFELVCSMHLLLGYLVTCRPEFDWSASRPTMMEFAPPWENPVLPAPGTQTPRAKRIIERAMVLAESVGKVEAQHLWQALQDEPEMVSLASKLAFVSFSPIRFETNFGSKAASRIPRIPRNLK